MSISTTDHSVEEDDESSLAQLKMLVSMLANEHKVYWELRFRDEKSDFAEQLGRGEDAISRLFIWYGKLPLFSSASLFIADLNIGSVFFCRKQRSTHRCHCPDLQSRILDVGTGHGMFCQVLRCLGYRE